VRSGRRSRSGWIVLAAALAATACGGDSDSGSPSTSGAEGGGNSVIHEFVALDAGGPLTKEALASGAIDVAVLFTSSADEASYDWFQLDDDRDLQPVENFVPAVRSDVLDEQIEMALDAVSAALTTEAVQAVVLRVGDDGETAADVAADFLASSEIPGARESGGGGLYPVKVGSASFPESEVVGEIYTQALLGAGIEAVHTPDLGFREVYFPALEAGDLDVVPEFVGSLLTHLGGEPTSDLDETLTALTSAAAERGVTVLAPAGAESKNGFYVRDANANQLGVATITDLTTIDRPLIFGGPAECPERPLCLAGLRDVYGLEFDV
jgi:osmoprotectant transport system substrate-binding protein